MECLLEKIGLFLSLKADIESGLLPVHRRLKLDRLDFLAVEPQTDLIHKVAERSFTRVFHANSNREDWQMRSYCHKAGARIVSLPLPGPSAWTHRR